VPTPINNIPGGLLSLLGSKGGGSYPNLLADVVASVLDISQLYLAINREQVSGAAVNAAAGTQGFVDLTVPAGELWWVHDFTIGSRMGATQTLTAACGYQQNANQSAFMVGDFVSLAVNAYGKIRAARVPLLLPPSSIPCAITQAQANTPTLTPTLAITRLRI
jgi:hypothetical protein